MKSREHEGIPVVENFDATKEANKKSGKSSEVVFNGEVWIVLPSGLAMKRIGK